MKINKDFNSSIMLSAILALLYFSTGQISLKLLSSNDIISVGIFAPEGIALAFALYFGRRILFGIFLGQFLLAYNNGITMISSIEISTINSIEALIGIVLFNNLKLNKNLESDKDIITLIFLIIFVLQPFSSIISNITLLMHSHIENTIFLNSIFSWWFGNSMGQLLFTPFLLLVFTHYKTINFKEYILYGIVFAIFVYFLEIYIVVENSFLLVCLTVPIVILIISEKGILYGTLMSFITAVVASYSVYLEIGAFNSSSSFDNTINFNLYILAHISIVLTVGMLFEDKKRYENNLHKMIEDGINKNKEQQLLMLQQSRLAQMGEMISMIAHQWRQPLNNLSLVNQLLISKYNKGKLDEDAILYFKTNSKRQIELMSSTIDDFRNFFKNETKKSEFVVNDIVENILDMTKDIYINNGIKINFTAEKKYKTIGYKNALAQAILNIINNARDALLDNNIENKEIKIDIYKLNNLIIISIQDNAGGIPLKIIDQIFDPYFSTKEEKNGTGLGLYMSKMIIEDKMDAKIIASNEKNGANFKIYLKEIKYAIK